ncbi:20056_t:CDS:2 [Gigaspora margarita]|uniref:20056_t:CDS:1 n=1 Tax=Gigaspora margarita TaxID=4874 RepID=A0ABN7V3M1_GIGMA|nr:20056_t:CDS:2 [Gigaspora margarita]
MPKLTKLPKIRIIHIHNNVAKCPILIPTCWNVNDCSPGSREIAAVRANNYIPRETGIYYFEIDILECEDDLVISVGVSASYTCLDRLAGSVCKSKIINQLYPAIGMGGMNSWIEANFGNKPFKFDIMLYAKTFKSQNGFLIL